MYGFALFAAGLALVLDSINAMNESSSRFRSKIGTAALCPAAISHRNRSARFVRRDARGPDSNSEALRCDRALP